MTMPVNTLMILFPAKELTTIPAKELTTIPAKELTTIPAKELKTIPAKELKTIPATELMMMMKMMIYYKLKLVKCIYPKMEKNTMLCKSMPLVRCGLTSLVLLVVRHSI